jgi:predicted CopG family antitoxin
MSASLKRATTITVTERTRRMLELVKGEGESFDEMLQDLLEETYFDDEFYQEIERRWRNEKHVSGPAVMKRAALA